MESVGDFLCGIFMTMFWIFRIIVTALAYLQIDFPFVSANVTTEIILLFLTFICIICVFKRVTIGGLLYCIAYGAYFGPSLYNNIITGVSSENMNVVLNDFFAIVLACVVLLNIIISKTRKVTHTHDTDWFYKGNKYDRELDERADKNHYKIY